MAYEIECQALAAQLRDGADAAPLLVDVREDIELSLAAFPGPVVHIPLHELAYRAPRELDPDRPVVTICHHGVRSLRAVAMLQQVGFTNVRSLRGGIDRWSIEIDPAVRRY